MAAKLRSQYLEPLFPLRDAPDIVRAILTVNSLTEMKKVAESTNRQEVELVEAMRKRREQLRGLDTAITEAAGCELLSKAEQLQAESLSVAQAWADDACLRFEVLLQPPPSADKKKPADAVGVAAALELDAIMPKLDECKAGKAALSRRVRADLSALEKMRATTVHDDAAAVRLYEQQSQLSFAQLLENHAAQQAVWSQIVEMFGQLQDLAGAHRGMAEAHLVRTEAEQKRRQLVRETKDAIGQQRNYLDDVENNTQTAIELLDEVRAAIEKGRANLKANASVANEIKKLTKMGLAGMHEAVYQYGTRNVKACHALDVRALGTDRVLDDLHLLPHLTAAERARQAELQLSRRTMQVRRDMLRQPLEALEARFHAISTKAIGVAPDTDWSSTSDPLWGRIHEAHARMREVFGDALGVHVDGEVEHRDVARRHLHHHERHLDGERACSPAEALHDGSDAPRPRSRAVLSSKRPVKLEEDRLR
jgi:hypothetical protein